MGMAAKVLAQQDTKEMTRRALRILLAIDGDSAETAQMCKEFKATYGEEV